MHVSIALHPRPRPSHDLLVISITGAVLLWHLCLVPSTALCQLNSPEVLSDTVHDGDLERADRDARARDRFQAGKKAYEDEDFRAAWQHFREAYLLSHRPQLLFNIGQAADQLGQAEDALTAFELYLDALPDAENAGLVRARMADLRALQAASATTETAAEAAVHHDANPLSPPSPSDGALHGPWLLRAAVGLGVYLASWSAEGSLDGSVRGGGFALDLAAGYELTPGMVVGANLLLNHQPAPAATQGDAPSQDLEGQTLWMLGPTAVLSLGARAQGAYLQGSLVLAGVNRATRVGTVGSAALGDGAFGAGVVVGGGYDVALSNDVLYGIAARLAGVTMGGDDVSLLALSLTALGTLTWY